MSGSRRRRRRQRPDRGNRRARAFRQLARAADILRKGNSGRDLEARIEEGLAELRAFYADATNEASETSAKEGIEQLIRSVTLIGGSALVLMEEMPTLLELAEASVVHEVELSRNPN